MIETPTDRQAREDFDKVITAAAAGDWEAIGLDPPDAPATPAPTAVGEAPGMVTVSIQDFLAAED